MRISIVLSTIVLLVGLSSCMDRHDKESEAMQNMSQTYDEALAEPLVIHFQHGYESFLRAALSVLPVDSVPSVFEGVRKVVHFNDAPKTNLWFADDGKIKKQFFDDLENEGFEVLVKFEQQGMDIAVYIKEDDHVHGAVIVMESPETVQAFDLAGDIDLKKLNDLIKGGDLNSLDIISNNFFDDIL